MSNNKPLRKPAWIRSKLPSKDRIGKVEKALRDERLVTVCEEANCPNRGECFCNGTATFMIMGNTCTRNCKFCNVNHGRPDPLDQNEPLKIAKTIQLLKLRYAVLTSVDRDDLIDGGAQHFANCIKEIRSLNPNTKIEILTPDFRGCQEQALQILQQQPADVFNHNIETIPRLYNSVCPSAAYQLSLTLLQKHRQLLPTIPTKSGLMVGLGETDAELIDVLHELRAHQVTGLTIGQYLQPTVNHLPVERYVPPAQFEEYARIAKELGFTHVASGPLVRSSYQAERQATGEWQ